MNKKMSLIAAICMVISLVAIFGWALSDEVEEIPLKEAVKGVHTSNSGPAHFRVSAALNTELQKTSSGEVDIIIKYKEEPGADEVEKVETEHKGDINHEYENLDYMAVTVPVQEVEEMAKDPEIELIDFDGLVETLLDTSREAIQVDSAVAQYGLSGSGVKVAVIDTGIFHNHPAIGHQVAGEIDYTGEGTEDILGHGTHVACIVACEDETYYGLAPGADLYVAKVIKSNGYGSTSDIIAAMDWAVSNDVDVINLSVGARYTNCGEDALSLAANDVVDQGVVVVASAGNRGPTPGTIYSPGCAENTIAVAATRDNISIWPKSSQGPTIDGRVKPDLLAPGWDIMAAYKNNGFFGLTGTSMAAPHVAGLAALMLQADSSQTPLDVKTLMMDTALDMGYIPNAQGAGLVQASPIFDVLIDDGSCSFGISDYLESEGKKKGTVYEWCFEFEDGFNECGYSLKEKTTINGMKIDLGCSTKYEDDGYAKNGRPDFDKGDPAIVSLSVKKWNAKKDGTCKEKKYCEHQFPNGDGDQTNNPIRPVFECVEENVDGTHTAYFGYLNSNDVSVEIPVGKDNKFDKKPQDRGQTTVFEPGRSGEYPNSAFSVVMDKNSLTWKVRGPDGKKRSAKAKKKSDKICQPSG